MTIHAARLRAELEEAGLELVPDGPHGRMVLRAVCTRTGHADEITYIPGAPPNQVIKHFGNLGWRLGRKPIFQTPRSETANVKTAAPQAAEEVAQWKHAIKIAHELEGLFVEGRFKKGHSDQTVADKLGLAKTFVAKVREETLGAIKSDPEIEEIRGEISALRRMIEEETATFKSMVKALEDRVSIHERRVIG